MGAALPFVAAAAIGVSALGSIAGGYATSSADKANASIAANNASIAKQNATFAGEEGEQHAGIQGQRTRQEAGSQKAGMGASGVNVNTGSNADVQAGTAMNSQLDMMNIRNNAARQAYGFDTQAVNYENQASVDRSSAHNAVSAGYIGAVTGAAKQAVGAYGAGDFSGGGADSASSLPVTENFTNSGASIDNSTLLNGNYNPGDVNWSNRLNTSALNGY